MEKIGHQNVGFFSSKKIIDFFANRRPLHPPTRKKNILPTSPTKVTEIKLPCQKNDLKIFCIVQSVVQIAVMYFIPTTCKTSHQDISCFQQTLSKCNMHKNLHSSKCSRKKQKQNKDINTYHEWFRQRGTKYDLQQSP